MRHPERTGLLNRLGGRGRFVLLLASAAFVMWMPTQAGAQLPSQINLTAIPGQEGTPVYRVFSDNLNDHLGGGDSTTPGGQLGAGDFNGDGFGDLVVGVPVANTAANSAAGTAYILYGSGALPGTYADLNTDGAIGGAGETRVLGGGENHLAGYALAVGDINGDGFDDAIVGEPGVGVDVVEGGGTVANPGHVRVVYGSATLPAVAVDLRSAPSSTGNATTELVGEVDNTEPTTSALFGRALASGDVNGDGFDDVIVGAYLTDTPGGTDAGAVYVIFGSGSLPGSTITAGGTPASGVSRILGDDAGDAFGWSVASGDVNGDGFDDIIVGAKTADTPGGTDAGEVHVIYGAAVFPSTIDLNTNGTLSAAQETRILGDDGAAPPAVTDNFGWSVSAGDVNGDGFDEVIVGAHYATPLTRSRAGECYVIYGKSTLPNSILNMNTSPNGTISSAGETRLLGAVSLDETGYSVGAGDVDGDGRADVLMGARQIASLGNGHAFVVAGATVPAASNVDLSTYTKKVKVKGALGLDLFGSSLMGGADLDRDGFGDVIGTAPGGDNPFLDPQNNAGYAAVVFGDGVSATATATTSFAAGATPLKGIGGRLSVGVRAWVSFDNGTAGKATGILTRNASDVTGIPEATTVDVAQVLWQLSTTRTGWTSGHVVLRYTDSEVAGLDETKLVLYQAASKTGPWTALTTALHDSDRNEFSADVSSLGYFAIAADTLGPALSISPPSADITRDAPVSYTITYTRAATYSLTVDDVQLHATGSANADVAVVQASADTFTVTLSNITGDGTLAISIAADTARDASDTPTPAAGPSVSFRVDHTPPEIAISAPSVTSASSGPVAYTVTYTDASTVTLNPADVQLVPTGSASAEVAVTGDAASNVRTVTLSNITGNGTLAIQLASGTASDEVGNLVAAAGPAASFTVDNTPPTVVIGAPSVSATRGGPVTFTVTYGGASTVSLNAGKVTLNRTGTANGSVAVTGSGTTSRTVTISSITGDGTLGISILADSARDALGNAALASGPSATFTVDNTGPTVSIGAPSVSSTQTGPVSFPITYTEASNVTLTAGNVTLIATGDVFGTVSIQGAGTTGRSVVIDNITGDGTLGISLVAGTASDALGNTAPAAGPSANVAVGAVELALSIGAPSVTLTRGGPVSFAVSYTGADQVTLQASDVSINTNGTVNGQVSVEGSGVLERTVTVSNLTGDGTFTISIAAGTASNNLGDTAQAVGTSQEVTVDNTAPTIDIGAPSAAQTQSGPVSYKVTYGNATSVTLQASDVTLASTGTATGIVSVQGSGATERTVVIDNITGDGTLGISIAAGTATDAAGNTALAAGPSTGVNVDNTVPTIAIGAPSATITGAGPVTFGVLYLGASEVNLTSADVTLLTSGTATADVAVTGSGTDSRTVTLSNISGDGTLGISIAAGTASDAAGNSAPSAGPSEAVNVDNTAPTLNIGPPSVTDTQAGPVSFEVQYQGADTVALLASDVTVIATGTAAADVSVSGGSGDTWTVTLTNVTGTGTLAISIQAGTALDEAGNAAPAAGPSEAVNVDNTAPTVAIGAPSVTTTGTGPVSFTVTYSGASAITLGSENVHLNTTGGVTGSVAVTGSGTEQRTITVTNLAGNGTFTISIDAGTATDDMGNTADAAGPSAAVTVQNSAFNVADVNHDGKLNATDVQLVINAALGRPVVGFPDTNGDNKVNATDVQRVINGVLGKV